jgi:hypothetical protein
VGKLIVRPFRDSDGAAIRHIFRSTIALGQPLPFPLPDFQRYESLCLDWYLTEGAVDAAVLDTGVSVVGYALVCTRPERYRRWNRRRALRFTGRIMTRLAVGRYGKEARRFYRLRMRDGWTLWRAGGDDPMPAHAHCNLLPGVRAGSAGRMLADHIDDRCRAAGVDGWFGEINAPCGRRAQALVRLGATVVRRAPNVTLSWLAGKPVERLTIVRHLPATEVVKNDAKRSA